MCDREGCWLSDDECTADYFDEKMQLAGEDYLKDPRMISDEAVEAAAKVLYADKISNHAGDNAPQIIDACEKVARKVLEAAAPHMLADAWDEGCSEGLLVNNGWEEGALEANPYRSQA